MNKTWSNILSIIAILTAITGYMHAQNGSSPDPNVFVITTDGLRWQEIFLGVDQVIVAKDTENANFFNDLLVYDIYESRAHILPFVWNSLSTHARFYGNRTLGNKVDTKNFHRFSYPGYNEFLCSSFDPFVATNKKVFNKNVSILEKLNSIPDYHGQVAAFCSWDVFPYILNEPRSGILINSGWEACLEGNTSVQMNKLNCANQLAPAWKGGTRFDDLTWQMAMEYTRVNHPKALFVSLDDTDHFGHKGDYKSYIQAIQAFDQYLQEIWTLIESDEFYKGNTYMIVTTDHGRGATAATWSKHGFLPSRSRETWLLEFGPDIKPTGEVSEAMQLWQSDIPTRIASHCNIIFKPHKAVDAPSNQPGDAIVIKKP